MSKETEKILTVASVFLLFLVLLFVAQGRIRKLQKELDTYKNAPADTVTVIRHDTIKVDSPVPVYKYIREKEYVTITDSLLVHDTVTHIIELPREYLVYKDTSYRAVVSGLRPRLEGKKRQYDCFDVRFREYAYLRWEVRYDKDDMSHVLAVSEDGRHRFLLEEKYVQPMALADRKEGDAEQLQRVANYNNALKQHTQTLFGEITAHAKPILGGGYVEQLESPDAHNDLAKALITDSKGQHKSQRASERRRILQAVDVEYSEERKPEPVPVVVENTPAGESRVNTFDLY